jgi:hypothetical protein
MNYKHIIFQHTPKCAGTSLREMLRATFGADQVTRDYEDGNIGNPLSAYNLDPVRYWREAKKLRLETIVVAGHMPIRKYAHIPKAFRFATIRHPVPRAVSQFCFWTREFKKQPGPHPVREYIRDNKLDILDFVQMPFARTFYRRLFFRGAKASDFDLIIDSDHFETGVAQASQMIGVELRPMKIGAISDISPEAGERERAIFADTGLTQRIGETLRQEIEFYNEACSWAPAVLGRTAI